MAQNGGDAASIAQLQEVVVTAEKRAQDIEAVPASISAFTESTIAETGIKDVSDLQFHVPSLMFGNQAGLTMTTLRGVGLNTSTGEIEGGVAVNVDGIYQPHPATGDEGQLDLIRIEVLKGPQGTLYGRNATGGAINFITAPPSETFKGRAVLEYGSFDEIHAQGKITGPLAHGIRGSLILDSQNQGEGFVRNVAGGPSLDRTNKLSGRAKLSIDIMPNLRMDLSVYGFHETGQDPYDVAQYPATPYLVTLEPRLANAVYSFEPWTTTDNAPSPLIRSSSSELAVLTWTPGSWTVTSKSSFQAVNERYSVDGDGANTDYDHFHRTDDMKNIIEEIDAAGAVGPVDLLAGTFLMHEDFNIYAAISFPTGAYFGVPPGYVLPFGYVLHARDYAVFTDETWHVTDRLRLIGGARFTYDHRTADQDLFNGACVASTTVTGSKGTWRGIVQYDLPGSQNVYGSVSTGYRNGGVAYSVCQEVYHPEEITAYEIGYKAKVTGTVTFDAAAFYYDYTNLQLNQQRTTNGQLVVDLVNVPRASIEGVEFQTTFSPLSGVRLGLAATWLDAQYGPFFNVDSQLPARFNGLQNLTGKTLNYAPKFSGTASIDYALPNFSTAGDLSGRLEYYATSRYYFREFNSPSYTQAGYGIANAYLSWNAHGRYTVRAWIKNIGNKAFIGSLIAQDLVGTNLITWNRPRQYGVGITVNF